MRDQLDRWLAAWRHFRHRTVICHAAATFRNVSRTGLAIIVGAAILAAVAIGAVFRWQDAERRPSPVEAPLSFQELTGSLFEIGRVEPLSAPKVVELSLPAFPDATAVWGATGRDPRGHIWIGVSATRDGMSAHLFEFDPNRGTWKDHGAVIDALKRSGLHRSGQGQIKIHSKIVPGGDGWMYFASADEEGETENGTLPRWGSHLWRIDPDNGRWEHLFAAPEALIAVSGVGRYVYALGYWGHVLYRYDTQERSIRRVVVGSVDSHVSRNLLADVRGHAYVPRIRSLASETTAELVEFDSELREVASTRLEFYLGKGTPGASHGITAISYLPDGRMLFATHRGRIYLIEPRTSSQAVVSDLGWLHPAGEAYVASLFTFGRPPWVGGLASRSGGHAWVSRDLRGRGSEISPLDLGGLSKPLLYGSITRDNAGRAYVGGWAAKKSGSSDMRPLLLQIEAAR